MQGMFVKLLNIITELEESGGATECDQHSGKAAFGVKLYCIHDTKINFNSQISWKETKIEKYTPCVWGLFGCFTSLLQPLRNQISLL
jgi:hypothetical protein